MAIDEAMLRSYRAAHMQPTLRLYGWETPAVSIGYFQDPRREVNGAYCRDHNISIVRRPTGGKAVLHGQDLTYSVVAGGDTMPFSTSIMETYRVVSRCLVGGLARAGVTAWMVDENECAGSLYKKKPCCFSRPLRHEITVNGRKICGSAQMRIRDAFLQHGSLLMDVDPAAVCRAIGTGNAVESREIEKLRRSVTSIRECAGDGLPLSMLCRCVTEGFEEGLSIRFAEGGLTAEEEQLAAKLLEGKYKTEQWNMEGRVIENGPDDDH